MSETTQLRGGAHNPVDARVSADQETIVGDGTTENPLRVQTGVGGAGSVVIAAVTDRATVLGDGTAGQPLHTNPDGVPVATDGQSIVGRGTKDDPLRATPSSMTTIVAAVTDRATVLGDGTAGQPLHTNPDGVPVATDGQSIAGRGTKDDPLRVVGSSGEPASSLPLAIHGAGFQVSKPGQIAAPGVALGLNGLFVPSLSGTVLAMAPVALPPGTLITSVTVRVTDNVGTPIEAHFGADDGSLLKTSRPSPGDGQEHDLEIDVGVPIAPGKSYFVDATNQGGNLGWAIHRATVA